MTRVFLGVGSNEGERLAHLEMALERLAELGPVRRSSWYETVPMSMGVAPWFLNGVVELETRIGPLGLLKLCLDIEKAAGRVRTALPGPRSLDIDILIYGEEIINVPGLRVPHPRLHERGFVLVPFSELAPDTVHPVLGISIAELARQVSSEGVEKAKVL